MLWSPARAQQQAPPTAAPLVSIGCPVAGHNRASNSSAMASGACPMLTADTSRADSSVVHEGCPVAAPSHQSEREGGVPFLRPDHIFIMVGVLCCNVVVGV
eukprot:917378-Pelagomonas_calceolata.AAC.1